MGAEASNTAFFLVGPTASGKTAVAQWIAERVGGDILSADSMLVYRGMDIGTAKPEAACRARVRYGGLDLVEPGTRFSVGDYRRHALEALARARADGRPLLVVGGTGLYVKCLTDGLEAETPPRPDIRQRAESLYATQGVAALQAWLQSVSPARYAALADKANPRRLIRALEKAEANPGEPPPRWTAAADGPRLPGLLWPPDQWRDRIERRVRAMYASGLLEEVERLLARGFADAPTAAQAIGYAEAVAVVRGACTREDAIARTIQRTRRLAKRQLTWFRHQARVDWLTVDDTQSVAEIAARVQDYWRQHGPVPIRT